MKQGRSLSELAAEIERQAKAKADYVAPVSIMSMRDNGRIDIGSDRPEGYAVNDIAHKQLAEYADMPAKYYDRLRAAYPALLAESVNTLGFRGHNGDKRLVRTLDGTARAFLSDRYRPLDNVQLMESVLPVLMETKGLSFASAQVTESRLYLKIISTELTGEVKRGDEVRAGLIVSNSEVGAGALMIAPFTERLVCTNGMVHVNYGNRKAHIGRALDADESRAAAYFTDETRAADDRAFFLKARDTINGFLSGDMLARILDDMRAAEAEKLPAAEVEKTVDAVAVQIGLNDAERANVLTRLIEGADLSRWGMANAVTRAAADVDSYDRATELEKAGGALLNTRLADIAPAPVKVRRAVRRELAAAGA